LQQFAALFDGGFGIRAKGCAGGPDRLIYIFSRSQRDSGDGFFIGRINDFPVVGYERVYPLSGDIKLTTIQQEIASGCFNRNSANRRIVALLILS
jgi:hypothetical protein